MTKTVLVIGAGITGVSVAHCLLRDGVDVTLIDRVMPGASEQASYGNGGILARCAIIPVSTPGLLSTAPKMLLDPNSPLFMRWSYLPRLLPWLLAFMKNGTRAQTHRIVAALEPLTSDSVDQHIALARGTGAEKFIQTGEYTYLYRNRREFVNDAFGMDLRRAHGFQIEERDSAALHESDPGLSPDYGFGAVFKQHGWITSPAGYVAALAESFTRAGGRFRQAEVVDLTNGGVTLKGGEVLSADKVVLAAGAWSKPLAQNLGLKVPLETERGYHLMLHAPNHVPPQPYMVADAKFVVTPMEDGFRCAGIVEFGGLVAPATKPPVNLLRKRIRQVYPGLSWQSEDVWMGHRPSTPDSLPMLGPVTNAPNVILAFGSQHIGLTIGPRLGRMVSDMVMGRKSNIDITAYSANRFG